MRMVVKKLIVISLIALLFILPIAYAQFKQVAPTFPTQNPKQIEATPGREKAQQVKGGGGTSGKCTDSDGGSVIYKKGTVDDTNGFLWKDTCIEKSGTFWTPRQTGTHVKEYTCTSEGLAKSKVHKCDFGCSNRTCTKKKSQLPPPSEEEKPPEKPGHKTATEEETTPKPKPKEEPRPEGAPPREEGPPSRAPKIEPETIEEIRIPTPLPTEEETRPEGAPPKPKVPPKEKEEEPAPIEGEEETTPPKSKKCADTDGGKKYYTEGTCSNFLTDSCLEDGATLREYYCTKPEGALTEYCGSVDYKCPGSCYSGICIGGGGADYWRIFMEWLGF